MYILDRFLRELCNYYYGNRAPPICFQDSPMFFWRLYSADCAENRHFSSKMQNRVQKLCRNRRFSSKMQNGIQKLCRNRHFPSKMQNQALILCRKSIPSGGHAKYTFIQKQRCSIDAFSPTLQRCFFFLLRNLFCLDDRISHGYFNLPPGFSVRLPASA